MPLRMEQLIGTGTIIIIIGFIVVFLGLFMGAKESNLKTKVAVGGFIGPMPFGFGNDKNLVWLVAVLSLVLFIVWLFMSFRITRI